MPPFLLANDPLDGSRPAKAGPTQWAFGAAGCLMLCGLAASFWGRTLEAAGFASVWGVCPGLLGAAIAIGAMRRTPAIRPSRESGTGPIGGR